MAIPLEGLQKMLDVLEEDPMMKQAIQKALNNIPKALKEKVHKRLHTFLKTYVHSTLKGPS